MQRLGLSLVLMLTVSAALAQGVYRWTDKDGKVHYSDQPPPPTVTKNVEQKKLIGNVIDTDKLSFAAQEAVKRNPVTLYVSKDCGDFCKNGRDLLAKRGVPFSEKDAQNDPKAAEELKALAGALEVPLLVVGAQNNKGFDADAWQKLLDQGGYPRTNTATGAAAK